MLGGLKEPGCELVALLARRLEAGPALLDVASGAGSELAAELGVQAGALYWHFASKQALLDAMADRFLAVLVADMPAGSWDEQLSALAWRLRQALLSHRDGARVMAGTYVAEPITILLGNTAVEILQAAGVSPDRAGWTAVAAMHYVLGHTIEEQAQIGLVERGAWEPKLVVDGIENKIAATAFAADPAERFRYGLELLLDGIRQQLARPASSARATSRRATRAKPNRPGASYKQARAQRSATQN